MKRNFWLVSLVLLIGSVLLIDPNFSGLAGAAAISEGLNPQGKPEIIQTGASQPAKVAAEFGRLPLYFIANRGQTDKRVKFYAQSGGQTTWFTKEGVAVSLSRPLAKPEPVKVKVKQRPGPMARAQMPEIKTTTVGLSPVGLRKGVKIAALEPQEHKVNYFFGNNPKKWRTDVPTYKAVAYREAYQGIDLKFYGDGRQLEYDIVVKPGADPNQVKFQYAGIKGLEVTPTGDLAIKLPDGGVLVQKKPVVYQEIAGTRVAREGKFKLHGDVAGHTYGFEVAAYDQKIALIIDPVLVYSTYLGGGDLDMGMTIQVDAAGCAYVAGATYSKLADPFPFPQVNPITNPSQYGPNMWNCVFVSKFNAAGNGLLYSTYLGGNPSNDYYAEPPSGRIGLAVDAAGSAYITGATMTTNFPHTTNAPYKTRWSDTYKNPASTEAFVTKLTSAGNGLAYSTYMRGDQTDFGHALAVDSLGNAYIGGYTESGSGDAPHVTLNGTHFPPYFRAPFITKLDPGGSAFLWTRALVTGPDDLNHGGTETGVQAMVAEPLNSSHAYSGGVWVTGDTLDEQFPVINPLQASLAGQIDAFVTWVDQDGVIRFSTFWGGGTGPMGDYTHGYGIARGPNGDIYVCGATNNAFFPTSPNASFPKSAIAYQPTYGGGDWDAILFRITNRYPQKPKLVYSTYLGGDATEEAQAVAVDQNGNAYITGATNSNNFPVQNALFPTQGANIFVAQMGYDGARMILGYSTFIGNSGAFAGGGGGFGIAHNGDASAYVTGGTNGGEGSFPLVNPYQNMLRGGSDAFALKISAALLPAPPPGPSGLSLPWLPLLLK